MIPGAVVMGVWHIVPIPMAMPIVMGGIYDQTTSQLNQQYQQQNGLYELLQHVHSNFSTDFFSYFEPQPTLNALAAEKRDTTSKGRKRLHQNGDTARFP